MSNTHLSLSLSLSFSQSSVKTNRDLLLGLTICEILIALVREERERVCVRVASLLCSSLSSFLLPSGSFQSW